MSTMTAQLVSGICMALCAAFVVYNSINTLLMGLHLPL